VSSGKAHLSYNMADAYHVARGLLGLGHFLWWGCRPADALEKISAAKVIFERLDCPASTSKCFYIMSRIYASTLNHPQALALGRQALMKAEQAGDAHLICQVLGINACFLMRLSCYGEAFDMLERALRESQALGAPLAIPQILELLAYNCAATVDFQGAKIAYERARVQYATMGSTNMAANGQKRCWENLWRLNIVNGMDQAVFSQLEKPMLY
jgi:hypothetical protein